MAVVTLVQTVNPSVSTGTITATLANTILGSLICVFIGSNGTTDTVNAPTDNAGNTYSNAYAPGTSNRCELWYARNTQPTTSVTVTFSGATNTKSVIVREYSGLYKCASVQDRVGSTAGATPSGSAASAVPSPGTTREVAELVLSSCTYVVASASLSVGAFYGNFAQQTIVSNASTHGIEDTLTSSITTPGATFGTSSAASGTYNMGIACFTASYGGVITPSSTRPHGFQPGTAR